MKRSELILLPRDTAWKDDFRKEKDRITALLRDPSARIEHVCSTSIPTVCAKPILDIAILCGEGGLDPVVKALLRSGYVYRDVLSRDPELAKEYTDYKLSLATTVPGKYEYAEIKTRWVDTFILKVLESNARSL